MKKVIATKVAKIALSDHYPTVIVRNLCRRNINQHISTKYRCFKKFDEEKFLDDPTNVPWLILDTFTDPNDVLDIWYILYYQVIDKHAPYHERRVKYRKKPEWLDEFHEHNKAVFCFDQYHT